VSAVIGRGSGSPIRRIFRGNNPPHLRRLYKVTWEVCWPLVGQDVVNVFGRELRSNVSQRRTSGEMRNYYGDAARAGKKYIENFQSVALLLCGWVGPTLGPACGGYNLCCAGCNAQLVVPNQISLRGGGGPLRVRGDGRRVGCGSWGEGAG
jgi:hypothetical protein